MKNHNETSREGTAKDKDISILMAPFRARIDQIDEQIIALLRARYDVIEEVGVFKFNYGIPCVLQGRVDEVRERAVSMAESKGLDGDLIRTLYAQLIEHSCQKEEDIKAHLSLEKAS